MEKQAPHCSSCQCASSFPRQPPARQEEIVIYCGFKSRVSFCQYKGFATQIFEQLGLSRAKIMYMIGDCHVDSPKWEVSASPPAPTQCLRLFLNFCPTQRLNKGFEPSFQRFVAQTNIEMTPDPPLYVVSVFAIVRIGKDITSSVDVEGIRRELIKLTDYSYPTAAGHNDGGGCCFEVADVTFDNDKRLSQGGVCAASMLKLNRRLDSALRSPLSLDSSSSSWEVVSKEGLEGRSGSVGSAWWSNTKGMLASLFGYTPTPSLPYYQL